MPARRRALPADVAALGAAPLPEATALMACTLVDEPFDSPDWVFEPKYDGLRVLARFDGRRLSLLSRNGKPQDLQFPDVQEALRAAVDRPVALDGEVVCFDGEGRTSFRALQQRFHLEDPAEIRERAETYPAFVYLFDILHLDGRDLTPLPLERRKELLHDAVGWSDRVLWTETAPGTEGTALWRRACREGNEGIIGKRLGSRYEPRRSEAWVKVKCLGRQEFVIGGFTDPQRSRVGLGALLVGYYDDDGGLAYAGKVGTGYTRETLLSLRSDLGAIEQAASPFDAGDPPRGEGVHWARPEKVAEIAFAEWTRHGLLRQPRFEGLRTDKAPRDCRRERPRPAGSTRRRASEAARTDRTSPPNERGDAMALEEYNAKRDFEKTDEPAGRVEEGRKAPIFVIQEHHASTLHYDFRLEADGVLKSWAVPKEPPSLDPAHKRLAVQVEDHPIAYAGFSGDIPEGEYGAGHVEIWDRGTYENLLAEKGLPRSVAEGIAAGRVEFALHGEKLRGRFNLIRMRGRGGKNWLLIKGRDEFARAEAEAASTPAPRRRAKSAKARPTRAAKAPEEFRAFTNTDKVMFPEAGITKGDLLDYYDEIADRLLPFLRDRPATLERLPEGLGPRKPRFWQKNLPESAPDWVPRIDLPTEEGETVRYALVNDRATLLYLVNQGTITFHVWASRVKDLDRPDFVLFDLDPGPAEFSEVVAVAKALHGELDEAGAEAMVKTSGKTGLHVLVPWGRRGGVDAARAWALEVAGRVAGSMPDRATTEIRKAKRGGRVYLDVMQNARGHHAVPPYVVRAVPGATVSTPLAWRELTAALDPGRFSVRTLSRRLARQKVDPLAGHAFWK